MTRAVVVGRLRALRQPGLAAPLVQDALRRLRPRVIRPEVFDEAAVARRTRLRDHYAEIGLLGRPQPPQTNREHRISQTTKVTKNAKKQIFLRAHRVLRG